MKKQLFISIVCLLFACASAQAQWSSNPAENLRISKEGDTNQFGVIVHPTNDGKMFVSWAEWHDGMNMYIKLQLLDMEGNALWEKGGIYIVTQQTCSYTGGYDMKVTPDGCAVIAHSDCRNDATKQTFELYAYKIDQEGNHLWGLDGVALPALENNAMRPQIGITNDGEILIGYNDCYEEDTKALFSIMKVNGDGTLGWTQPLHIDGMMGCFAPCGESDLFLSIVHNGDITVRCLDVYGEEVWAEPIVVENRDPNVYNETYPLPDGKGNIIMPYQRYISQEVFYAGMQRVSPEGELLMGLTGIDLSTEYGQHSIPGIGVNAEREEIAAFWSFSGEGNASRLYVQKFNYNGDPIWEQPVEVANKLAWEYFRAGSVVLDDGSIILIYGDADGSVEMDLMICKLDDKGNTLWNKQLGVTANVKEPMSLFTEDQVYIFWADNREDPTNNFCGVTIWGQNVYYTDGSMGPSAIESVKASESGIIRFDGTNFNVTVANAGQLYIYNTNGALVKTADLVAGENNVAANLAAGLYIARVAAEGDSETLKVIVK